MTFEMTCAECGASYEVGREEIARGIQFWSRCPACRQQVANELPKPDEQEGADAA